MQSFNVLPNWKFLFVWSIVFGGYSFLGLTEQARASLRFAGLNGWGSSTSYTLDQAISIPSSVTGSTLSFYLKTLTDETTTATAYDTLKVQAISGGVTTTLATYSNLNKSTGYVLKTLDLSSFKGKTVTLRFLGVEDSSLKTYFFVDDTSVATS